MIRRVPSKQRNSLIHRERDRSLIKKLVGLLVCGLVLSSGFVYAARQHFAALQLGYDSENLRRERQQLLEEQHRLLLDREEAASPVKLERAARQLGMQPVSPSQVMPARQRSSFPDHNSKPTGPVNGNSVAAPANGAGLD
jgi:cell division protein FtsL